MSSPKSSQKRRKTFDHRLESCVQRREKKGIDHKITASNPVLQIDLNAPNEEENFKDVPSIQVTGTDSLLADLLYPLEPSQFMENFFRKKAVHISTKGKYQNCIHDLIHEHFCSLDMESILNTTSYDNIFVWLLSQNKAISSPPSSKNKNIGSETNASTLRSVEISSPSTALSLHHAGHATYCRAPAEVEQYLVSSLLRDTGFGCGQYDPSGTSCTTMGRGEVEVFAGTKNHFTNWHFDFQENFTIQLSGIKRWRLKQGHVKYPKRGCTPHYYYALTDDNVKMNNPMVESQLKSHRLSNPNFEFGRQNVPANAYGDEVEILMYPGDILYFSAGMWHSVETVEVGVSINVSLMACDALKHLLLQKDQWRETVLNDLNQPNGIHGNNILTKVKGLLNTKHGDRV